MAGEFLFGDKGNRVQLHSAMGLKDPRRIAEPDTGGHHFRFGEGGTATKSECLEPGCSTGTNVVAVGMLPSGTLSFLVRRGKSICGDTDGKVWLGRLSTYGTTFRVTPMTDGTRHSIRMTNRGTTLGAGVIFRGQAVVGHGFSNPKRGGVCCK